MPPRFDFDLFAEGLARGGLIGLGAAADIAKGRREAEDLRLKQLREFFEFGKRFPRADFGGAPSGGLGGLGSVAQAAGAVGAAEAAGAAGVAGTERDRPGLPGGLPRPAVEPRSAFIEALLAGQEEELARQTASDIKILGNLYTEGLNRTDALRDVLTRMEEDMSVLEGKAKLQKAEFDRQYKADPKSEKTEAARIALRKTLGAIADLRELRLEAALEFETSNETTKRYGRLLLGQGVTNDELKRLTIERRTRALDEIIFRMTGGQARERRRR